MSDTNTRPAESPAKSEKPAAATEKSKPVGRPPGISSVNRKAVMGPDAPAKGQTPRERLCGLLNLKAPSDHQLLSDAAAEIEKLREKLANPPERSEDN